MKAKTATKSTPHHHGNLRAALIEAGVALVCEHGPDALSIRKVAAIAGVSHAAPAHHFPTLAHLRTAIIAHSHRLFSQSMQNEMDAAAGTTPRAILLAAGRGYIKFAVANPALYLLMFGGSELIFTDPEFLAAAGASTAILETISAPIVSGSAGAQGNQLLVWSIIHGFAGILLHDKTGRIEMETAPQLLEQIFPELPMKD